MSHAPTTAAPDIDQSIRAAQDQLLWVERAMVVTGDPSAPMFGALAALAGAQHAMLGDVRTLLAKNQPSTAVRSDADVQRLAQQLAQRATLEVRHLSRRVVARNIALAAGALVVALVVGASGGYWFGSNYELSRLLEVQAAFPVALTGQGAMQWLDLMRLNDITRSSRTCAPQNGREACSIVLWTQPPAAAR